MTIDNIINNQFFKPLTKYKIEYINVYTCDLLSLALVKGPKDACFITVINNANTIAVCVKKGWPLVILPDGIKATGEMIDKANEYQITLVESELSSVDIIRILEVSKC